MCEDTCRVFLLISRTTVPPNFYIKKNVGDRRLIIPIKGRIYTEAFRMVDSGQMQQYSIY